MDYGYFHRAARRSVSECVLEKVETVEVRRPNSLSRGLVEHRKFHGAKTNALALARRFAAAGFSFVDLSPRLFLFPHLELKIKPACLRGRD